jgi:aminoglycoside 6'-N-acetyltransferase I
MNLTIRLLGPEDGHLLDNVAHDVFDNAVDNQLTAEFLSDPRHHLAVAIDGDKIVGIASGVHYVHPDKRPQMFINEVAVASTHQKSGVGRSMLQLLLQCARELECTEAWVLTDWENMAAQRLYTSVGGVVPPEECIMFTIPLIEPSE